MADNDTPHELITLRERMGVIADVAQGLVTRDATMAQQVTNLVSSFTEHKTDSKAFMGEARDTLAEINEQVTKTNGRVNGHDREIRDLKDTMNWAIRLLIGLNATVVGGIIIGVAVYWVNNK